MIASKRKRQQQAQHMGSLRIGATICYEGIFPEISRYLKDAGTELHVNVTNDGWYGISSAATQHFLFYAMRAVESGTPEQNRSASWTPIRLMSES